MDSSTESNISSVVSTPTATPITEVGDQPISQSLPESLEKRWTDILIRDEFLEYPSQTLAV